MKPILLILTTSFVFSASAALAQGDQCSKQYGACMDRCSSRPSAAQAECSQSCEANTDRCYVGLYGQPGNNSPVVSEPARDAQDSADLPAKKKAK